MHKQNLRVEAFYVLDTQALHLREGVYYAAAIRATSAECAAALLPLAGRCPGRLDREEVVVDQEIYPQAEGARLFFGVESFGYTDGCGYEAHTIRKERGVFASSEEEAKRLLGTERILEVGLT